MVLGHARGEVNAVHDLLEDRGVANTIHSQKSVSGVEVGAESWVGVGEEDELISLDVPLRDRDGNPKLGRIVEGSSEDL